MVDNLRPYNYHQETGIPSVLIDAPSISAALHTDMGKFLHLFLSSDKNTDRFRRNYHLIFSLFLCFQFEFEPDALLE